MRGPRRPRHDLSGTTLKVYLYLLRRGRPVGVRELQRELGLSSPSLAAYHLNKLQDMGLVERDADGKYYVRRLPDSPLLAYLVRVGAVTIPRMALYAAFTGTLLAFYVRMLLHSPSTPKDLLALIALAFSVSAFVYEAWRAWKLLRGG